MEFEPTLLRAVVQSPSSWSKFKSLRPEVDDFDDPASKRVLDFVNEYASKYDGFPSVEMVSAVSRIGFPDEVGAKDDYLIEQFVNRRLFRRTQKAMEAAKLLLAKNDPKAAFGSLSEFVSAMQGLNTFTAPVSMFDLGDEVLKKIAGESAGDSGIPFPWPSLTRATNGMYPGTATLFVARPGTGKTMVAVIQTLKSWREERRVLIVSPEMDRYEIAERFFVIDSGVSYARVVQGGVAQAEMDKLRERLSVLAEMHGVYVMDGDAACDLSAIESTIRLLQPDLVCIDAGYMLRSEGRGDKERMDKIFEWVRSTAKRCRTAMMMFHQLSRDAEKDEKEGGGAKMGNIALTDRGGWDFYNIFALEQDRDMAMDKVMRIRKLKIRRPAHPFSFVDVQWNFHDMCFDEIDRVSIGAKRADKKSEKKSSFKDEDDGVPF